MRPYIHNKAIQTFCPNSKGQLAQKHAELARLRTVVAEMSAAHATHRRLLDKASATASGTNPALQKMEASLASHQTALVKQLSAPPSSALVGRVAMTSMGGAALLVGPSITK